MRIGRSALDEDAIRLIEQHNPDIEFDWTHILKSQDGAGELSSAGQPPLGQAGKGQPRHSGPAQFERRSRPRESESAFPVVRSAPSNIDTVQEKPELTEPPDIATASVPVEAVVPDTEDGSDTVATVEQFLVEPRVEPPLPRPQPGDALSVVEARLGSEGLSRLRARYAEVLARISETVSDPARQEELKGQAERLNPDTWVTEAEVRAGLEDYESVFESLRSVVGRRRRRRRRSAGARVKDVSEPSQQDATIIDPDVDDEDEAGPAE